MSDLQNLIVHKQSHCNIRVVSEGLEMNSTNSSHAQVCPDKILWHEPNCTRGLVVA